MEPPADSKQAAPDVLASRCPSRKLLRDVTGRWAPLVLICLDDGFIRFSDLHRASDGSNERMLAHTLTTLVDDGFVARTQGANKRPGYELTEGGQEVARQLKAVRDALHNYMGHKA